MTHYSNACCEGGHYICDTCHGQAGFLTITEYVTNTISANPVNIAMEMMKDSNINMHGPEHHYLVAAALLAAYKNAGGQVDFTKTLQIIAQRAKNVPGGICGLWGSCGAAISSGIFISAITGATPLSVEEWALANKITSCALAVISENGGPRCCKRNSFLAIYQAAEFVKKNFGHNLELPNRVECEFSRRNEQCRGNKCLFF